MDNQLIDIRVTALFLSLSNILYILAMICSGDWL